MKFLNIFQRALKCIRLVGCLEVIGSYWKLLEVIGGGQLTILIAWSYGKLSARQTKLFEQMSKQGDFVQLHKSYVSPTDLAALTGFTGDEFGLFTLGSRRIVVRGYEGGIKMDADLQEKLLSEGWKWSAHTHSGMSDKV